MAESQVKIQLTAEDKASAVMKKAAAAHQQYLRSYESIGQYNSRMKQEADAAAAATSKLGDETEKAGRQAQQAEGGFGGLFKTITLATVAATAIQAGMRLISTQFRESIEAATRFNSAMAGLASYATSFGVEASAARAAAQSLSADGLLPVTNSANALKNLLATGLSLDQATQLIQTFKDRAAFGRNSTIEFGTAVENLSQAFKTEQSVLSDASGMTENYSQILESGAEILGKNVNELTRLERAQAKFLGIQQISNASMGDAARYAETAAGQQARYAYEIEKTHVRMGQMLQPAVAVLTQGFGRFLQTLNSTSQGTQEAQAYLVTFAAVIRSVANVVVGAAQIIYGAIKSIMTLSWDPLLQGIDAAAQGFIDTWDDAYAQYEKIYTGAVDDQVSTNNDALNQMSQAQRKALARVQEQIDDANRAFERSMESRTRQFEESLWDMIIAHRDKSRAIRDDLKAEDAAYAESARRREQDYLEDVESMEERHAEKVADITEKITEEKAKGILLDGVFYAQANDKKIAELEEQLREETAEYEKQRAKRKAQYEQDVADDKARHDSKRAQLTQELNAELAILQKHRTDVARVGDAQKEDDITRLKRQFAEATAEANRNHQEQLARIRRQANEQGSAAGSGMVAGTNAALAGGKGLLGSTANQLGNDIGKGIADGIKKGLDSQGQRFSFTHWMRTNVFDKIGQAWNNLWNSYKQTDWGKLIANWTQGQSNFARDIGNFFGVDGNTLSRLFTGRASGGPVMAGRPYVVGEREPELFVPRQSGQILNQRQLQQVLQGSQSGTGGVSIGTVNITNQTPMDWTAQLREMAFELR